MKIQNLFLAVLIVCNAFILMGQGQAYVTADNGLTVREQPNPNARRIGKLHYGEAVEVTETTSITFSLLDDGEKINGQWVKIQSPTIAGYVFNGFLSNDEVVYPLTFRFDDLKIKLKNLNTLDEFKIHSLHDTDTIKVSVSLGDSPENKILTINSSGYKHISIFQRFENSISILNEGPHCDLRQWKHYNSNWKPIESLSQTKFRTLAYNMSEKRQFIDISISELKAEVRDQCGQHWENYIKDITTVNDFPADVGISRIFLKFLLTDSNDNVIEKIIEFEIPMGC